MNLSLVRTAYLQDATLGVLSVGHLTVKTLEEPWRPDLDGPGGEAGISCVPDGTYELVPHDGAKQTNVWALVNPRLGVYRWGADIPFGQRWGRAAVLIHAGNSTADIEGCVLVGRRHGYEQNKPWLYESKSALEELRALLQRDKHTLTIRPTAGTLEIAA